MKLDSETVSYLLHYVPSITTWLRHKNPQDAANHLAHYSQSSGSRNTQKSHTEIQNALSMMMNADDPLAASTNEIRKIFSQFSDGLWYTILATLITSAAAPIMTSSCYEGLLEYYTDLKETFDERRGALDPDLVDELRYSLERLPFECYFALGEVCALVRDTSTSIGTNCGSMALNILLPEELQPSDLNSRNLTHSRPAERTRGERILKDAKKQQNEAVTIFRFLCVWAEILFFKNPVKKGRNMRKTSKLRSLSPQSLKRVPSCGYRKMLFKDEGPLNPLQGKIDALTEFLQKIDHQFEVPFCDEIAQNMLELFGFHQVCEALLRKYEKIPAGWTRELSIYMNEHKLSIPWFSQTISLYELQSGPRAFSPTPKATSNIPWNVKRVQSQKMKLQEKCNQVINELITGETAYFTQLYEFTEHFVKGIRKSEVYSSELKDAVFGERFIAIVDAIRHVNLMLEILRIIPDEPEPIGSSSRIKMKTRAGVLAVLLRRGLESAKAGYESYLGGHVAALKFISSWKNTNEKSNDYNGYYEMVKGRGQELPKMSVEALMQGPVRRIPNYVLLLTRIQKYLEQNRETLNCDGDVTQLGKAISYAKDYGAALDVEVKKKGKLIKLLGKEVHHQTSD
eukprot:augustus_masked-scaffold_42-processed-gene-1.4-mRNA-1 protein AED:1.00 eAED:1.00 QI:0/-1/0/0/-1/1/1/0/625